MRRTPITPEPAEPPPITWPQVLGDLALAVGIVTSLYIAIEIVMAFISIFHDLPWPG